MKSVKGLAAAVDRMEARKDQAKKPKVDSKGGLSFLTSRGDYGESHDYDFEGADDEPDGKKKE